MMLWVFIGSPGTEERHTPVYSAPTPPTARTTADSDDVENPGHGQGQGRPSRNLGTPPRFTLDDQQDTPLHSARQQGAASYGGGAQGYSAAVQPSPAHASIGDTAEAGSAVATAPGVVELQMMQEPRPPISAAAVAAAALVGVTAGLPLRAPAMTDNDGDSYHTANSRPGYSLQSSQSETFYTPYNHSRQASQQGSVGGTHGAVTPAESPHTVTGKSNLSKMDNAGTDSENTNSAKLKVDSICPESFGDDGPWTANNMQYISSRAEIVDDEGYGGIATSMAVAAADTIAAAGAVTSGKAKARGKQGDAGAVGAPAQHGQGISTTKIPSRAADRKALKTSVAATAAVKSVRSKNATIAEGSSKARDPGNPAVSSASFRAAIAEAKR